MSFNTSQSILEVQCNQRIESYYLEYFETIIANIHTVVRLRIIKIKT